MDFIKIEIPGLLIIKPDVYKDSRGFFYESYNKTRFALNDFNWNFLQDNISVSSKNTLRGLHFQTKPYQQGKLVSVLKGSAIDVAVDIRKDSEFFGKHYAIELSEFNNLLFWIPPGFAHGFIALEDNTVFSYKCTEEYHKESELSIRWNDPSIGIPWGTENPLLSDKDLNSPFLNDILSLI